MTARTTPPRDRLAGAPGDSAEEADGQIVRPGLAANGHPDRRAQRLVVSVGNFLRRPGSDWGLFLEASARLSLVKVALLVAPFRWIAGRLGTTGHETPSEAWSNDAQAQTVRRVEWAIQAAARSIPLGFVCLPQAIGAKWMLRRRGIETTLYLGLASDRAGRVKPLSAHAWLRAGDRIATGRRESRRHKAIATFGGVDAFPPELDNLLALLRAALGGGMSPVSISDPEALVRGLARHRVGAFLHHRLPDSVRAALPARVQEALADQARRNALRSMRQAATLERIARRFHEAGVHFLSVKGPLLARRLYDDPVIRHAGDLDLLISEPDLDRAEALLLADGYRRTRPHLALTPRQRRHYSEKEFEFQNHSRNQRVELRWLLDGVGDLPRLTSVARTATLRGSEFAILPEPQEAIYLSLHGALHGWRRLFWLVDMALLFQREGVDWTGVLREARGRGVERAILEAAALAEELLGVRPPEAFASAGARKIITRLTRNAKEQIALPARDVGSVRNFLRETAHRSLLHRRWSGKWQILQPHFHSVRNWEDLPLPDTWFWLYPPLAPVLWLCRRIRQSFKKPKIGFPAG